MGEPPILGLGMPTQSGNLSSTGQLVVREGGDPVPIPPAEPTAGIWISVDEILALPNSGAAYNAVVSHSNALKIGGANLASQNHPHAHDLLARAYVAVREGSDSQKAIVRTELMDVVDGGTESGSPFATAPGRMYHCYIFAAELVGLSPSDEARFKSRSLELRDFQTGGGGGALTIKTTHNTRPNNVGTQCGASRMAIDLYVGDITDFEKASDVLEGLVGDRSVYSNVVGSPGFNYGALGWQFDSSNPVGINQLGATKNGHDIDGVLPEDQRRCSSSFSWPPCFTGYVWEGLQGFHGQAVILHRRGKDVWNWSDRALLRTVTWNYSTADGKANRPATGDDTWQPWLTNHYYNLNGTGNAFPTTLPSQPGKGIGYTDWTHAGNFS